MDPDAWKRVAVAGAVVLVALVAAKLLDRALVRRVRLAPETLTRYRVLRRSVTAVVVAVGLLSALLVVPEVRAVAGGVLASSAVVALVVGMAARSTLANFVGGMLIAFTQPLRIGDEIEVAGAAGSVEEIALTYTTLRAAGGARYYIPNEKLASDTIRNATIGGSRHLAQVRVPVPLTSDLERAVVLVEEETRAVAGPQGEEATASVSDFEAGGNATVTVETWAAAGEAARVEDEIRRRVHARLRAEGVY
ncbi:MAG: mechanosensitive ion channel [Thermoleophilia bacterium]|nr:mechanosensitive ion channel [Thermoleophilia bacterium]